MEEMNKKENYSLFKNEPSELSETEFYKSISKPEVELDLNSADNAFARYLNEFYKETNLEYFKVLVRFVVLFRSFLNERNQEKKEEAGSVYTSKEGAAKLPESCNDFISEVEKKKDMDLSTEDSIDIILHFCFWLHEQKYTKSVLSLLN